MKIIIIILSLVLVSHPVLSDENTDRYGALPAIQKMSVSPSGEKIAFRRVSQEHDFISIISVNPLKQLSAVDVSSVQPDNVRFIDDEYLLLNVSTEVGVQGFRGEIAMSTALTYNIAKDKYHHLLSPGRDEVYGGQADIGRVIGISPDTKWAYIPAFSGEPVYSAGQQLDPPMSLFKVKINGKGKPRIYKRGRGGARDYFVGDDGALLARESFNEKRNIHSVFAIHGKKSVEIYSQETPYATVAFVGVSFDEQHLIMVADNPKTNQEAIYKLALKDGAIEGPLYNKAGADVTRTIKDWQRKVLGIQYSGFYPSYTFFDKDLNQRVQAILAEFPQHSVYISDISPDRHHILVHVEGSQSAGDYFLFSKGKPSKYIASLRPNIPTDQIHPIGTVNFKARDGLKIPTVITIPRTKIDDMKNLPAIMLPHGGPTVFDAVGFDFIAQAFAEQGYLVIQPNFRGSRGFGSVHEAAGYGEWGGKSLDDLSDAVSYFAKSGMIDSNRVCIVGGSYGGYAALAGGAFTPDLYKCVVSINGLGNLPDMLKRTRERSGSASTNLAYWEAQVFGFGEQDKNVAKQRSPELSAASFKAPVLLIHSEKDAVVHPRQSITMYRALKKANKQVEKLELKDENHYMEKGPTRLQALKAMVKFVNKHI